MTYVITESCIKCKYVDGVEATLVHKHKRVTRGTLHRQAN